MSEIKIEKGIPIPPRGGSKAKYPFADMEIGDSFVMPKRQNLTAAYGRIVARRMGKGWKFTTSSKDLPPGHTRIWRIA